MNKPRDNAYVAKLAATAEASDGHGSVRETLESILIAFVLAFIFRAFVVEAFVIPTGSMAPTLLGQHVQMDCPQCGHRFTMGPRNKLDVKGGGSIDNPTQGPIEVPCPMCRYAIYESESPLNAGDRILVLKYVYVFNEPTRWDVVVFKNPTNPDENYIKRLVGLPGEQLLIAGGDIFTRPLNSTNDDDWKIQSKPDFVQRAVWQPVYRSDFYPLDGGDPGKSDRSVAWKMPWRTVGADGAWSHESTGPRFVYDATKGESGELAFDASEVFISTTPRRIDPSVNYYAYNIFPPGARHGVGDHPFRDMRIAATVAPQSEGLRLVLTASDFERVYRAVIAPDGKAVLQSTERPGTTTASLESAKWDDLATSVAPVNLPVGSGTRVELWLVDGELSLFVDESRVALSTGDRVDIPRQPTPAPHPRTRNQPIARVGVSGASATLRGVDLDRDLYHTSEGTTGVSRPAVIGEGHYYCLGDNSPQSQDGRRWGHVDEWVLELTGTPASELTGYVPEDLMIGRAFFVYFPAGYETAEWAPRRLRLLPNFGKMRFIH